MPTAHPRKALCTALLTSAAPRVRLSQRCDNQPAAVARRRRSASGSGRRLPSVLGRADRLDRGQR
eukprot:1390574-Prymnesium_polylepis.2